VHLPSKVLAAMLLDILILLQAHQNRALAGMNWWQPMQLYFLTTTSLPACRAARRPACIDSLGQGSLLTSQQEGREVEHLIIGQMQVWHAQSFRLALHFALIVNIRSASLCSKNPLWSYQDSSPDRRATAPDLLVLDRFRIVAAAFAQLL